MGKAEAVREGSATSRARSCVLPEAWVERIFQRMHGFYGNLWLDRYRIGQSDGEGRDVGLENAKAMWAEELGGFAAEQIGHALEQMRHVKLPPTLPEFLELCRQAPRSSTSPPALPEKTDPEVAQRRLAEIRRVIARKLT